MKYAPGGQHIRSNVLGYPALSGAPESNPKRTRPITQTPLWKLLWPKVLPGRPARRIRSIQVSLLLLLAPVAARAQWPFPTPAAAASATPFQGFPDMNGPGDHQNGQPPNDIPLIEKPFDQLSDQHLDPLGQAALAMRPNEWKHAETDNFVIHYRRVTEAEKVAREVEYDLWFVATSLGATKDQYSRKSHVFIFEDQNDWKNFLSHAPAVPQWAASFARGDELFLNLRDTEWGTPFDSRTLAHETTHAVVARLYPGSHWPLWLNEGFAEYMGAASVAKRMGQPIQAHEHTLDFATMSLDEIQQLKVYPQDPVEVAELYETAEKLIRFIMTELPRDRFTRFIAAVTQGDSLKDALLSVYPDKLASYDDFLQKFSRFSK
ncbi:MAG: hypothetical protein ABSE62_09585 [Chthoniobacteraceae bacterium]